jgi:hypothetical protein
MSKTPNFALAQVDAFKLTDYLLNIAHPDGAPKARFFILFGFAPGAPDQLRQAFLEHVATHEASEISTPFGMRYIVDGPLNSPSGRAPLVRTVWQADEGSTAPRLITAMPLERS